MSNTDTHAVTGRSVRRLTGRPGRAGEHPGRTRARTSHPSTARTEGAVLELTLLDLFEATVATWGERPAVDAPRGVLTYNDLAAEVKELADRLRADGVGPGDRVGVRVPSGKADLYVAILGVLASGAAYVPVDADDPDARAEQIFADAGVCAVVGKSLEVAWRGPAGGRVGRPTPDDDAWIIFTSGSTGKPKGVAVQHRAAAAFVRAEDDLWKVLPEDRVLAGLSVAFDASCEEMWLAWAHGAALVPAPRALVRSGVELGPWLKEHGITVISTVPTLAGIWDDDALSNVRLLILGGEACPEHLVQRLAPGRELWNTYGPTEATVVATAIRLSPGAPVTIGKPLRGWELAVVDPEGQLVADGEAGELVISGVGLGHYLKPELDAERYRSLPAMGWKRAYRTGDIVRQTEHGLEFVGRRDHQVKIGGRRIELGEVDGVLSSVAGVRGACTVVRESAAGNKILVGYVAGEVDPQDVRAVAAERMPASLVPLIIVLDELPMATSGKVDRKALPWPPPGTEATAGDDGSLTSAERSLAERWREQLGPVAIDADSDFFALGGTSLAVAKLVSALRAEHPAIAVADVYEHRTLRELAARLESVGGLATDAKPEFSFGAMRRLGLMQLDRRVRPVRDPVGSVAARGARLRRHRGHRHAARRVALARRGLGAAREPACAHCAPVPLHPRAARRPEARPLFPLLLPGRAVVVRRPLGGGDAIPAARRDAVGGPLRPARRRRRWRGRAPGDGTARGLAAAHRRGRDGRVERRHARLVDRWPGARRRRDPDRRRRPRWLPRVAQPRRGDRRRRRDRGRHRRHRGDPIRRALGRRPRASDRLGWRQLAGGSPDNRARARLDVAVRREPRARTGDRGRRDRSRGRRAGPARQRPADAPELVRRDPGGGGDLHRRVRPDDRDPRRAHAAARVAARAAGVVRRALASRLGAVVRRRAQAELEHAAVPAVRVDVHTALVPDDGPEDREGHRDLGDHRSEPARVVRRAEPVHRRHRLLWRAVA